MPGKESRSLELQTPKLFSLGRKLFMGHPDLGRNLGFAPLVCPVSVPFCIYPVPLISLTDVVNYVIFFHTVRMRGPISSRHTVAFAEFSLRMGISIAIRGPSKYEDLIYSIFQYAVPPTTIVCTLFPASDIVDDEPVGSPLIRVRLFSISYHLMQLHALRLYAPYVTHLFACIRRSTLLPL